MKASETLLGSGVQVELLGLQYLETIEAGTAVTLNASLCAPGYGVHSKHTVLIVQLAPAYFLHDVAHAILSQWPSIEPGMIKADGEVGQLVLHSPSKEHIQAAQNWLLAQCQVEEAPKPEVTIDSLGLLGPLTDRHISLLNRGRNGALAVAGDHMLRLVVKPANQVFSLLEQLACWDSHVKLMDTRLTPQAGQLSLVGDKLRMQQIAAELTE